MMKCQLVDPYLQPTLQQIRQANLRKIFEEEGAEAPCDICGDPTHDYRKCSKEAYQE